MPISSTITLQQVVAADSIPSNTGRIRTTNIQIPTNLGNLGMKLRQQITASDVVSKGIGDGHAQKENSHTTEDKIKDFIQKGVNKKLQEVGYQFSSILLLLPHVLIKSRKLSTAKCYWGYFEKWDSWRNQFSEVSAIPEEENAIILYLLSLLQTGKSYPAIRSSVFAIKYFRKIVGHHDPCNSELVNYVLEGIKRICCHTPKKKKPFTPQLLHTLYRSLGEDNMNLINLRTMLLCVLSFMGFLRFSEVINLKNSDIILKETHMSIFIEKSKTDVYREGYWMHLSKLQ